MKQIIINGEKFDEATLRHQAEKVFDTYTKHFIYTLCNAAITSTPNKHGIAVVEMEVL